MHLYDKLALVWVYDVSVSEDSDALSMYEYHMVNLLDYIKGHVFICNDQLMEHCVNLLQLTL
jgi:hypothetical protein